VQPPPGWQPPHLAIQLISRQQLQDLSGAAYRQLAFSLHAKLHGQLPHSFIPPGGGRPQLSQASCAASPWPPARQLAHGTPGPSSAGPHAGPAGQEPAPQPYEPAVVLAPPQRAPGQAARTLHCCYHCLCGSSGEGGGSAAGERWWPRVPVPQLLAVTWTDGDGTLLHSRLLRMPDGSCDPHSRLGPTTPPQAAEPVPSSRPAAGGAAGEAGAAGAAAAAEPAAAAGLADAGGDEALAGQQALAAQQQAAQQRQQQQQQQQHLDPQVLAWLQVCMHVLQASLQLQQQLCGDAAGCGLHSPLPSSAGGTQRAWRLQLEQLAVVRVGEMAAAEAAAWQLALGPCPKQGAEQEAAGQPRQKEPEQEAPQPQHRWRQQLALCSSPLQGVAVAQVLVEGPLQASLTSDSPGPAFLVRPWLLQPGGAGARPAADTATALALSPPYSNAAVACAGAGSAVQLSALHVQLVAAAEGLPGGGASSQQQHLHASQPAAKRHKSSAAGACEGLGLQAAGACSAASLAAQLHRLGGLNAALGLLCGGGAGVVRVEDSCWRDGHGALPLAGHLPLHAARCLRLLSDAAMLLAA
jgi:hypothetical protein